MKPLPLFHTDKTATPNKLNQDFKAMQCAFGLFRLLLLYHSPLLSARLDRAGFQPELYLVSEQVP